MIKEKIDKFLKNIPAIPENVRKCAFYLEEGDLTKASYEASLDLAFSNYLINIINKPIFGFTNYVKDIKQIFSILGIERASQIVNAYYASLILPKKWKVFKINNTDFQFLQSNLIFYWNKILNHLNYNHIYISSVVSLIPGSLVVCEEIFEENYEDIILLKEHQSISYDEILYKISGLTIFDILKQICIKWELNEKSIKFIDYFSKKIEDETMYSKLAKYLHLLVFYEISKPEYIEAGINDFVEFDIGFVQDIYEDFSKIVELS